MYKIAPKIYKLQIYLNSYTYEHTHIYTRLRACVCVCLYKMAALSCSRHCRHSLPLTFPLYLSVCPLHFIYLSVSVSTFACYLSVCLSVCLSVSLSVCRSVCLSLYLSACLLVVCYLHSDLPFRPSSNSLCALLVFIYPLFLRFSLHFVVVVF